jgi:hypothetical protein
MKKGIEWFKLLSEKEQQEFKENCRNLEWLMSEEIDFESFITSAFYWNDSPQGWDYWSEISKRQL